MKTIYLVKDYHNNEVMAYFDDMEEALSFDAEYGGCWSGLQEVVLYDTLDEFQAANPSFRWKVQPEDCFHVFG